MTLVAGGVIAIGCASDQALPRDEAMHQIELKEQEVAELKRAIDSRERELDRSKRQIEQLSQQVESANTAAVSAAPSGGAALASGGDLLPPSAKAGECYARVYEAPKYENRTIQKLKQAASERIEVISPRFEWEEQQILVQEPTTKLVEVPAEYGWEEEEVLVKPAHTVWKKGRGPIEKIDDATGEIMCLVEVPAEYKTVRTRVLKSAATTRRVEIPGVYKTVRVKKLVEAASERRVEIPAEYQTITQRTQVSGGRMAWRPVLCETNTTPGTVTAIQRALKAAGHDPGAIDGVVGRETLAAVKSFQTQKGLATGGLTYATIDALGVAAKR
jgi:hypothetical protein